MSESNIHQSIEELLKLVLIDRKRKVRMSVSLKDGDDEVPIKEAVEKLTDFILEKLKEEKSNPCRTQIMPLMGQAVVTGLSRLLGDNAVSYLLSDETTRMGLIDMMTMSFYLYRWLQQKNIKICTTEEPISQLDIDMYDRCSRASTLTYNYAATGGDPMKMLREMYKRGMVRKEDLLTLGTTDVDAFIADIEKEEEEKADSPSTKN